MKLNYLMVCDTPQLWGLSNAGPVGLVPMTAAGGERFTVTCDAPYAELMLDVMAGRSSEPLNLAAQAFDLFRWGWMADWPEAARADVTAWRSASEVFAYEPFGGV